MYAADDAHCLLNTLNMEGYVAVYSLDYIMYTVGLCIHANLIKALVKKAVNGICYDTGP